MQNSPLENRHASLLDPVSCGENLLHNAARICELAPEYCVDCADYHIRSAVQRCAGIAKGLNHERPRLIQMMQEIVEKRCAASRATIDIVIPGSADTGILATCAHAVAKLGLSKPNRFRFTVLDRCPTPLILCQEYAAQHQISLQTCQVDLLRVSRHFETDLIVVHSLFRFINRLNQVALLDKFGSWLKPGGRVIVSTSLRDGGQEEMQAEVRKRTAANLVIKDLLANGLFITPESVDQILARLDRSMGDSEGRPGEIQTLVDAQNLFSQSQLREISSENLSLKLEIAPDDVIMRNRVLAVLCCADEPVTASA